MKKIYTLIALAILALSSTAQWVQAPQMSSMTHVIEPQDPHTVVQNNEDQNLRGDFLWADDFENMDNWNMTNLGDYGWMITADENGWYFNSVINSLSDGSYAFVWNGDPNDELNPVEESLYTMTLADPIDVSGVESAILNFNLYGARFDETLLVQVSNDGASWTTVGDVADIEQLTNLGGSATANSITRPYNITTHVAGEDDLYIQFVFEGTIAYGWMIDDVRLEVPLDHNVRLDDYWTGDIDNDYEYRMLPQQQVIPLYVGGSTTNFGANEESVSLAVEVFLEGEIDPVFTGTSPAVIISQGQTDTIWWDTGYLPEDMGEYTVNFEIMSESEDQTAGDDTGTKTFMTTDFLWGNDDYTNFSGQFNGVLGSVASGDEWLIGTAFQVSNEGSYYSGCQLRLASGTSLTQEIRVSLYVFIGGQDLWEQMVESEIYYQLQSGDQIGFLDIQAEDLVELEIGNSYLLTVQHQEGSGSLRLRGNSTDDYDNSTWIFGNYNGDGESWFTLADFSPTLRLGLEGFISTTDISADAKLALEQNFPNPFAKNTTIPYSVDKAERVEFQVFDLAGKEVMNMSQGVKTPGNHRIQLNASALPAGIYFYTLTAGDEKLTKKMTVH